MPLKLNSTGGGSVTLDVGSTASNTTLTLPSTSGTVIAGTNGIAPESSGGTGTTTGYYGFKNRIINGAMMIDQRNAGASSTPATSTFTLDRWKTYTSQASKFTIQQNAGSVASVALTGQTNYLGVTSSSAYSIVSSDNFMVSQLIEGYNTADLAWGTSAAKTVTLSFWVYSSLTGTFGGSVVNAALNRSYVFSYTITAANTWQYVTATIPGDTTGTWIGATNAASMYVSFNFGSGSTNIAAPGSWVAGAYFAPTGQTSVVGTNGATFYITGVQLEKGSTATSFDYRPYGTELALCQRYYYQTGTSISYLRYSESGLIYLTTGVEVGVNFPVTMRTAPSFVSSAANTFICYNGSLNGAPSGISLTSSSSWMALLNLTGFSGLTIGQAACLLNGTGTSYISFSAEL